MNAIIEQLDRVGIIPVVSISDPAKASCVAKAVAGGGIPVIEVTFRNEFAAESIRNISRENPDVLVGAGTVLTCQQVDEALESGAKFIVAPGFNRKVVEYALKKDAVVIPGCATPSEVEAAMELGLDTVKLFPAECLGGAKFVKALSSVYKNMHFVPTGGISPENLAGYYGVENVAACGGSWLTPASAIDAGDYAAITELCRKAVDIMLGFEMRHVGINNADNEAGQLVADRLVEVFGIPRTKEGKGSIFVGAYAEVMKKNFLGSHGHIAMATNSIRRAIYQLKRNGVRFNENSAAINPQGKMIAIYLEEEFGGFAAHLLQK